MPEPATIVPKRATMMLLQLVADLVDGEVAVGAHDLAQEHGRVLDPDRVGAERAQAHRAELGVARDHRVLRAPFQVGEHARAAEIDLGLERALEAVLPALQRGEDRQVAREQLVHAGRERVGDLALVDEDRRLALRAR